MEKQLLGYRPRALELARQLLPQSGEHQFNIIGFWICIILRLCHPLYSLCYVDGWCATPATSLYLR